MSDMTNTQTGDMLQRYVEDKRSAKPALSPWRTTCIAGMQEQARKILTSHLRSLSLERIVSERYRLAFLDIDDNCEPQQYLLAHFPAVHLTSDSDELEALWGHREAVLERFESVLHSTVNGVIEHFFQDVKQIECRIAEIADRAYKKCNVELKNEREEQLDLVVHTVQPIDDHILPLLQPPELLMWYASYKDIAFEVEGTYVIVDARGVAYVGQSKDVHRRLSQSHEMVARLRGQWCCYGIVATSRRKDLEALLIASLSPQWNKIQPMPSHVYPVLAGPGLAIPD